MNAPKRDNKSQLLKLVLRYLNSVDVEDSADGGKAIVDKLIEELEDIDDKDKIPNLEGANKQSEVVKPDVEEPSSKYPVDKSSESVDTKASGSGGANTNVTEVRYHKFRECKINGEIGAPGQSGKLSYTSLTFQINQRLEEGYTKGQIYCAVIQAIKADDPLRQVLEVRKNRDLPGLSALLRSHYCEDDPGAILQLLRKCTQEPGMTAHSFCLKAILLRDKAARLAEERKQPFDDDFLKSTFFKAIYTGLRQNNIRMEIAHLLKANTCDDTLLDEIAAASANEAERVEKTKAKVEVKKVSVETDSEEIPSAKAQKKEKKVKKSSKEGSIDGKD